MNICAHPGGICIISLPLLTHVLLHVVLLWAVDSLVVQLASWARGVQWM
jgi:hypothetical protein